MKVYIAVESTLREETSRDILAVCRTKTNADAAAKGHAYEYAQNNLRFGYHVVKFDGQYEVRDANDDIVGSTYVVTRELHD